VRGGIGGNLKGKRVRKKCILIPGDGDPCPRCGNPMQIRAYAVRKSLGSVAERDRPRIAVGMTPS
jgi:hypothetical protein